jgi:hypothetical protein
MAYKYEDNFDDINTCLSQNFKEKDIESYRIALNPLDRSSFIPPAVMKPTRIINLNDDRKCPMYALSFFNSENNLKKHYSKLKKRNKNIGNSIGNNIAHGMLGKSDGKCSRISSKGHFDLHEYENAELHRKFTIVGTLS